VEAIRALDDQVLVGLVPDPRVEVASVRRLGGAFLGLACPDCQTETGWDYLQWCWFFMREER
jgi:hypothetical protein